MTDSAILSTLQFLIDEWIARNRVGQDILIADLGVTVRPGRCDLREVLGAALEQHVPRAIAAHLTQEQPVPGRGPS